MNFPVQQLPAFLVTTSFAAGLNLYATIATLGLLSRLGLVTLPPSLQGLGSWAIIAVSLALFVVEFFADKVPAFDLLWNALHTFIRVPIAAVLAFRATAQLSPTEQLLAATAGGLIALAAHGGKTAVRAAITPSPEPLSNIGLSFGEDIVAIGLTWFATRHPYLSAAVVACFLILIIVLLRWIMRALRALFRGARSRIGNPFQSQNSA